ncbi:hypothetical protein P691DRAFT_732123 [Macrolepiota fuliginosa MF-IS2]|uniref:Nephrocystin 3-like N-terminal domain-containing protein n=1 Tax=Macrolepiota fuliginosa MF-IS2 TaxID=1400762 RepID=A0A9P5X9B5_9AGAR|nr:hypothetical protein P691DRAFT_732123 [Macrolepiota fuliginosa MF-IS2]
MPAAIHDSSDRAYPPQCHPSTRKCLRERVTKWGIGGGNDGRMLWLLGLAAVGKSAVAQTIAEEFQEAGRLGASFFFSRPNHLNDPDAIIPTLVYQLTTKVPQYKHIINSRLADDPWILKKNRRTQFRELIIEPFHILMTQHPHAREELQIDDGEAQKDVKCLLGIEFDKIRKRYKDCLPDGWPSEGCFHRIVGAASGHLGFASFVLRFIGDKGYGDPDGQLKICMKFLDGGGALGGISPLHSLDLLYRQILSDVPANDLPTTMRILGLLILYSYVSTYIDDLVKFLNLDPARFHRSLERLHSILYVSPPDLPPISLRIYHASFSDFLKDPVRSGRFCLNEGVVQLDIALQSLHWLGHNGKGFTYTITAYAIHLFGFYRTIATITLATTLPPKSLLRRNWVGRVL